MSSIFLPSNGGLFFVLILAMFLFRQPLALLWDGGTCRHIVNGVYIFENGSVPLENYLWAINPKSPWMTHDILADIVFGGTYIPWGLNGTVLVGAVAIALSLTWAYQMARERGLGMLVGMISTVAVMYAASIHWSSRPHILTYLPFLAIYWFTFCSPPSKAKPFLAALVFTLWSNLHGSFPLGLVMIGCKLFLRKPAEFRNSEWKEDAKLLLGAFVGSCMNLRGIGFFIYTLQYMSNPVIQFRSGEWRSLDLSLGPQVWTFIALAALLFVLFLRAPKKPPLAEAVFVLLLFAFSCHSMRIIPYFLMAGMIAAGPSWASLPQWSLDLRLGKTEPRSISAVAFWCATALAVAAFWLWSPGFKIADFDPSEQPVVCSNYLKEHNISGLGFNWDNYGDYLFWKTGKPIFVDDKTDMYPRDFIEEYARLYFTHPGWEQVLQKYRFAWILIPNKIPLADYLKQSPRWQVKCEDSCSALFVPSASGGNSGAK